MFLFCWARDVYRRISGVVDHVLGLLIYYACFFYIHHAYVRTEADSGPMMPMKLHVAVNDWVQAKDYRPFQQSMGVEYAPRFSLERKKATNLREATPSRSAGAKENESSKRQRRKGKWCWTESSWAHRGGSGWGWQGAAWWRAGRMVEEGTAEASTQWWGGAV